MIYKLYLYDSTQESNDYKGTDYSAYISQGTEIQHNLDDTLQTAELTLAGLDFKEEFEPNTKFILETYDVDDNGDLILNATYHFEVANDTVSRPIISDDTYFNHSLSLIEPIVEAQNRLVDNIAVTYKLKDVSLEIPTTYNEDIPVTKVQKDVNNVSSDNYGNFTGPFWETRRVGHQFLWTMPNWYTVNINGSDILPSAFDWESFKYYQITDTSKTIEFPVPMLEIKSSIANTKTFQHNGYASIDCIITETNRTTGEVTNTIYTINPDNTDTNENWTADSMSTVDAERIYGWIESRPYAYVSLMTHQIVQVAESVSGKINRKISFTAQAGYSYTISFKLHSFGTQPCYFGYSHYFFYFAPTNTSSSTSNVYPEFSFSLICVTQENTQQIFIQSAPPQNALNLFQKAVLTTQDNVKSSGIKATDTPTTFYLQDSDYQELQNTQVVENFYNQKNLFEIFMDVGKYIHARPYVEFGKDNQYVVKWRRYGLTDQFTNNGQPVSIFNSKFVEEYISAISSYVTNMVQIGGTITETVAPKSSSEDYLVYNDVAQIIVNKPIIEIISVTAINSSGIERDMTEYVYEQGIYKLLPVTRTPLPQIHYDTMADFPAVGIENTIYIADDTGFYYTYNTTSASYSQIDFNIYNEVSKGMAVYYQLGDNKIQGLNYRMPTVNTGEKENDYAIKRILNKIFSIGDSTGIKVNDYTFRIVYRTKDTLRVNQTRPDLRKYLLASKYDKFPQHSQFNNQEDGLVDSIKFGNNTYGKLIRTGNTIYTYNEVCTSLGQLKQIGQLYEINGNLYYVSKVHNVYFAEYILSQIEFSKDFNRLSQIIGIPSEPRFYEISEQSLIAREKTFDDFLVLGTSAKSTDLSGSFIRSYGLINYGLQYVADLLLGNETYPQYAVTYFKNDVDTKDSTYPNRELFCKDICSPISTYSIENTLTMEWDMEDNFSAGNKVTLTDKSINTNGNVLSEITGVLGDDVVNIIYSGLSSTDTAYNILSPVQYCDANGRADLVDFAIIKEFTPTTAQTLALPENPIDIIAENSKGTYIFGNQYPQYFGLIITAQSDKFAIDIDKIKFQDKISKVSGTYEFIYYNPYNGNGAAWTLNNEEIELSDYGLMVSGVPTNNDKFTITVIPNNYSGQILLKDNRETIKLNYNLQMLTDSDRFVISAYMWQKEKQNLKLGLLKEEVNKISNDTIPDTAFSITGLDFTYNISNNSIVIDIADAISEQDLTDIKAIAIYSTDEISNNGGAKYFIFARNITDLTDTDARSNWIISNYNKNMFTKQ